MKGQEYEVMTITRRVSGIHQPAGAEYSNHEMELKIIKKRGIGVQGVGG